MIGAIGSGVAGSCVSSLLSGQQTFWQVNGFGYSVVISLISCQCQCYTYMRFNIITNSIRILNVLQEDGITLSFNECLRNGWTITNTDANAWP